MLHAVETKKPTLLAIAERLEQITYGVRLIPANYSCDGGWRHQEALGNERRG
jgi:hypothetical protein